MVIFLNIQEYKKIVDSKKVKEPELKNYLKSFFSGGLIGLFGEIFVYILNNCFCISIENSYIYLCIFLIFIASLLTSIGIFDDLVLKARCGLIIPTTGFAHSVSSSVIDYKHEGLITGIGANFFKLAGSVIVYSVIAAFLLTIIKVII